MWSVDREYFDSTLTPSPGLRWRRERNEVREQLSRLDAAISHHRRDCEENGVPDVHDVELWAARDRVLRDSRGDTQDIQRTTLYPTD
jgi:hypothetical protein